MVDVDELLDIVDQMRMALPDEIKEARTMQQDRERFLAQTQEEAARILAQAEEDAARLVNEHVLIQAAMDRAAQIEKEARSSAAATRKGSDAYAAKVLSELKARLEQIAGQVAMLQNQVDNGLNYIAGQSGATEPAASEPEQMVEQMDS